MNIYFLVEGRRTEKKVYPKWLGHLVPELNEISANRAHDITNNEYLVFNGNGFPSILDNHLRKAVEEVNSVGRFNYLVMCIDADEVEVNFRIQEVQSFIEDEQIELNENTEFVLIVQNRCIETWCLGNRRVFKRNPDEEILREYVDFYNVSTNDPELMGKIDDFETHAQFHASYLKEMLYERNIRYTKKNPNGVTNAAYFNELVERNRDTNHIITFRSFLDFCNKVKEEIEEENAR